MLLSLKSLFFTVLSIVVVARPADNFNTFTDILDRFNVDEAGRLQLAKLISSDILPFLPDISKSSTSTSNENDNDNNKISKGSKASGKPDRSGGLKNKLPNEIIRSDAASDNLPKELFPDEIIPAQKHLKNRRKQESKRGILQAFNQVASTEKASKKNADQNKSSQKLDRKKSSKKPTRKTVKNTSDSDSDSDSESSEDY